MNPRFKIYLIEPCPVTAAHLSVFVRGMGGSVYHANNYYLSNTGLPAAHLNACEAIESDLAMVAITPHQKNKALSLATLLHWKFELPVIWSSTLPIETDRRHYMLEQDFPIIRKPFSEYQVKKIIRESISLR